MEKEKDNEWRAKMVAEDDKSSTLKPKYDTFTLKNGDIVHIKKDMLGYRIVEPPTKWYHYILGGKRNAFVLIFLLILVLALYLGINELIAQYKDVVANPCAYCSNCLVNPQWRVNISIP